MVFRAKGKLAAVVITVVAGIGSGVSVLSLAASETTSVGAQTKDRAAYTGHTLSRLRGAMSSPDLKEADLRVLGDEWKANLLRWQIVEVSDPEDKLEHLPNYDKWLDGQLKKLDDALPLCEKFGLMVVVDLHTPPGGKNHLFKSKAYSEKFLEVWERMARRFKGRKIIWGYDLCNEPNDSGRGPDALDWHALALAAAKKIHEIDPDHAIIVEPLGGTMENLMTFEPLPVPGVVYSIHMYSPLTFTHQGVNKDYPAPQNEPTKDAIRRFLQPAIDYQRKYNVHIFLGEFSAIRWAPGDSACDYMRNVINVAEENNWDWSYHAFREWDGWSVEHDSDPNNHRQSKTQTSRETLLRSWFAKNDKPEQIKKE